MKWILILGIVLLFVYEFWALWNHKPEDTISEIVWKFAKHPLLPFSFGVLMGHFFW